MKTPSPNPIVESLLEYWYNPPAMAEISRGFNPNYESSDPRYLSVEMREDKDGIYYVQLRLVKGELVWLRVNDYIPPKLEEVHDPAHFLVEGNGVTPINRF